jgi:hypothetical protein
VVAKELRHRPIYILALISFAAPFLAYQAKPIFEIDVGEQGDTYYLRDLHASAHVDEHSCRWVSERSCLLLPGTGRYALALLRLRPDVQTPAVELSVSGGELSPSDVSSDAEVAATLIVSLKFYGALLLCSILACLIRRRPNKALHRSPPVGWLRT